MQMLEAIDTDSDKLIPPPQFLETAQRISQLLSLDLQKILDGYPMTYQGTDFWLQHYGQADPNGMVLMVEVSRLRPDSEAQVLRGLMEYHYAASVGIAGYYAIMPGSDLLAFCRRIDFERTPNPAGEIFEFINTVVENRDTFNALLASQNGGQVPESSSTPPDLYN